MLYCICDACGWTWRDWRAVQIRAAKGCGHCGAAWGADYHGWDGRDPRTGQPARRVADIWQGLPPLEVAEEVLTAAANRSQPAKQPAAKRAKQPAKRPAAKSSAAKGAAKRAKSPAASAPAKRAKRPAAPAARGARGNATARRSA